MKLVSVLTAAAFATLMISTVSATQAQGLGTDMSSSSLAEVDFAANAAFADKPFERGRVIGVVAEHWHGVGFLVDGLRSQLGLAVLYIIALGLVVAETRKLMVYFRPTYRYKSP